MNRASSGIIWLCLRTAERIDEYGMLTIARRIFAAPPSVEKRMTLQRPISHLAVRNVCQSTHMLLNASWFKAAHVVQFRAREHDEASLHRKATLLGLETQCAQKRSEVQ